MSIATTPEFKQLVEAIDRDIPADVASDLLAAFYDAVRAEAAADVRRAELPSFPPGERVELVAKMMRAIDARIAEHGAEAPYGVAARPSEHGPLWELLDWSFWGAGMGDTFREPLADTMLAAVPAETVAQAEAVMAEFIERRKIEKTGVTVWQEQRDELKELRAQVAQLKRDSAELAALNAAGVDNWEGYSAALESGDR